MKNEREWNAKYQTGISVKSQKKNRSSSYKTPVWARMFSLNLKCVHPAWVSVLSQVWTAGGGIYVMLCQISNIGVVIFPPSPPSQSSVDQNNSMWAEENSFSVWDVSSKAVKNIMM